MYYRLSQDTPGLAVHLPPDVVTEHVEDEHFTPDHSRHGGWRHATPDEWTRILSVHEERLTRK